MIDISSMDSRLCWYTFYDDYCMNSSERTHQTNVGAILVDTYAAMPCRFAKNPTHNILLNLNKSQIPVSSIMVRREHRADALFSK